MPAVFDVKSGAPNRSIRYQLAGYKILVDEDLYQESANSLMEFDEDKHIYKIRGVRVPSVTQVLNSVGLSKCSEYVSDEALWWGTQVHKMVELFHKDRLDEDQLDPLLWPRLEGYKMFVQDYGFNPIWCEVPIGSRKYGFAGKPDLYGTTKLDEGKISAHTKRYSVHLMEDKKYLVIPYENYSDESVFLNAVAVCQEKLRVGLEK